MTVAKSGEVMSDGTVFAGAVEGEDLYTTPEDAPLTYTFNEAANYAEQLNAQKFLGHDDWRVPTKGELDVLFNNRAAIGGFNASGQYPDGWYWSSTPDFQPVVAWAQDFRDGWPLSNTPVWRSLSLRCVRG